MMVKNSKRGVSAVFGVILTLIAVLLPASIYYLTMYQYSDSLKNAIALEEERLQEKIFINGLSIRNDSGIEIVYAIRVNNTGSITSRIRSIYINNEFLFDPFAAINPQNYTIIYFPTGIREVRYVPTDIILVATERGVKSQETMGNLYEDKDSESKPIKYYFGPLVLNFTRFYCANSTAKGVIILPWKAGWSINTKSTSYMVWNITVTNIDDRNITLNKYSCFTLFRNDVGGGQLAWYIDIPGGSGFTIPKNSTRSIIYIWDKWNSNTAQKMNFPSCQARVFLTFFGVFHEKDGTTKPYGQTIPFEAVSCS